MPLSLLKNKETFVSVESKNIGYQISIADKTIFVTRRHLWLTIAGLPPIYRFVGDLSKLHRENDSALIPGLVTMQSHVKFFFSIWFGLLVIFLTTNLAWAVLLAGKALLSLEAIPVDDLASIGFMLGSGILIALIGLSAWSAMRFLFRHERLRLMQFCRGHREMGSESSLQ
jgi:hypothetical protein